MAPGARRAAERGVRQRVLGARDDGAADGAEVPRELLDELAHAMVEPWRQRLVSAIDGAADDPDAITQRLGARYREYRGRELEDALGDALAAAWARGTYAAVPDGTLLRWVPAEVGPVPGLRRQRARADRAERAVPHRAAASRRPIRAAGASSRSAEPAAAKR